MNIAIDPTSEERIQLELDRGHYSQPAEVIAHALNLLQAEQEWLETSKVALNARLEESMAQIERGEGIPGDHIFAVLAERRKERLSKAWTGSSSHLMPQTISKTSGHILPRRQAKRLPNA